MAEQAAREEQEGVAAQRRPRPEINREELLKEIEARVDRHSKETLTLAIDSQDFKQQIIQMVRGGIQPVIETIAREISERAVRQATANLSTETGGSSTNRGTAAMVISIVAQQERPPP